MLPRQVVLTATHTHCGPLFYPMMMPGDPELQYAERLCEQLASVAVEARSCAVPGRVSFSRTRSGFGVNRRLPRRGQSGVRPQSGRTGRPRPRHPLVRERKGRAAGHPDRVRLSRHQHGRLSDRRGITPGSSAPGCAKGQGRRRSSAPDAPATCGPGTTPGETASGARRSTRSPPRARASPKKYWQDGPHRRPSTRAGLRSPGSSTCSPTPGSRTGHTSTDSPPAKRGSAGGGRIT